MLFDLDTFKGVNEKWGHQEGDRVLKKVAACLKGSIRRGDLLARYGGDEFLVVAPGGPHLARALAQRALEEVKEKTGLSISEGISVWPADGDTPEALVRAADIRLGDRKKQKGLRRGAAPRRNEPWPSPKEARHRA